MKKLIIICEGQTEELFCDKLLKPHFAQFDIEIEYPLIAHSGGGIVKWEHIKRQIELHQLTDTTAHVTTFIDYYGIYDHHTFPDWTLAEVEPDKAKRMDTLEAGMLNDLAANSQTQFTPYIQLHEFETLVLSDETAFTTYYEPTEFDGPNLNILCSNPPETINDGLATAPSKRLKALIPSYDKVTDGTELSVIIGLDKMRTKCPRFDTWIETLEGI